MSENYSYLDVLSKINKRLDPQQKNACCRKINSIVAAGAGSGKTQVLATRFAWLLMEDENLHASNILTLTFTKKAAAEMYGRIYKTLNLFMSSEDVPLKQRQNAKRALEEFASVHIQTLDSYCSGILRQCANRYGIRPDFSSGNGSGESEIKNQALKFLLKNINRPGVNYFCELAGLQDFADKVFARIIINYTSLATPENYFVSFLPVQSSEILDQWNRLCNPESDSYIVNQIKNIASSLSIDELKKALNVNKSLQKFIKLAENFGDLKCFENDYLSENKISDSIKTAQEISERLFELPEFKSTAKDLLFIAPEFEKLKHNINLISGIASYIKEYNYLKDLYLLLDEFTLSVNALKRKTGSLTFKDVSELSLKVLIEQKDIRTQEKTAYKKIMIDEFQDNNSKNRDLLFLLAEKDDVYTEYSDYDKNPNGLHKLLQENLCLEKLFFVGDEKQSIYKFRGAEVDVFNNLKEDLQKINGPESYCHMIYNYRSSPELLSSFNILFGGLDSAVNKVNGVSSVFDSDNSESYEANYNSEAYAKYVNKEYQEMPPVELNENNVKAHVGMLLCNSEYNQLKDQNLIPKDSLEMEAYYLAQKIELLHSQNVPYSNIAILDRNRNDRHIYTRYLEKFNIPYVLDAQSKLFSDGIVNDVYNFLRLCVYPSDINSFSAWICSPFCGLNPEQLQIVLSCFNYVQNSEEKFYAFDSQFEDKIKTAFANDGEGFDRYSSAKNFYIDNKEKILSQPLTSTLNDLWYKAGYRYETLINTNVNVLEEHYDLLFELAAECDSEGKSLAWFIDQLSLQKASECSRNSDDNELNIKDLNYPLEKSDAVQYMTIHKSKGLQFDYVFILGCTDGISGSSSRKIIADEKFGILVKSTGVKNYFEVLAEDLQVRKTLAEYRRQIYVGITRAVKEFTVLGSQSFKKDGSLSSTDNAPLKDVIIHYYDLTDAEKLMRAETSEKKSVYTNGAPFDFELIPFYTKSILYKNTEHSLDFQKQKIIEAVEKKYSELSDNNQIICKPAPQIKKLSPSDLEIQEKENESVQSENSSELSKEIDKFMSPLLTSKSFSFDMLGTFVHKYIELFILQGNYDNPDYSSINKNIYESVRKLDNTKQQQLFTICKKICENFSSSELGKTAINSFPKTEYVFKYFKDQYLITGSIDLFFRNQNGEYVIIDYKTDHNINCQKYAGQQTCYKEALSELYGVEKDKIKVYLYFVRYNKFTDITKDTEIELNGTIFKEILELQSEKSENLSINDNFLQGQKLVYNDEK